MAGVTAKQRAQRAVLTRSYQRRFPLKPCAFCKVLYQPKTRKQANNPHACCSISHSVKWRIARGVFAGQTLSSKGGRTSAIKRRAQARDRVAAAFGGPVTDRDLAMFTLGWKLSYDTHRSHLVRKMRRAEVEAADFARRSRAIDRLRVAS